MTTRKEIQKANRGSRKVLKETSKTLSLIEELDVEFKELEEKMKNFLT